MEVTVSRAFLALGLLGALVVLGFTGAIPVACSSSSSSPPNAEDDAAPSVEAGMEVEAGMDVGTGESAIADAPADAALDSGLAPEAAADSAGVDAAAGGAEGGSDGALPAPTGACAGSLLSDCSFETPALAAGGTQLFSNGQSIGAWTVVGATGNVNTIDTTFMQDGFTFEAEDGQQSLDLTGTSNSATGVAQTVTTTIGTEYQLAFWVGNVVDPDGIFGVTSTVEVQIDGSDAYSAVNANGTGTMTLDWEEFSFTFVATSASTTVGFINEDPSNDTSNFIDNVTLVAVGGNDM
jgi:hypothetical protein